MTADEIRATAARAEAASDAPWEPLAVGEGADALCYGEPRKYPTIHVRGGIVATLPLVWGQGRIRPEADLAFIAAARTDVPALAAECLRLRAEIADVHRRAQTAEGELARIPSEDTLRGERARYIDRAQAAEKALAESHARVAATMTPEREAQSERREGER
jgi:hypothetical protein